MQQSVESSIRLNNEQSRSPPPTQLIFGPSSSDLFPGIYDGLLTWPFPKKIHLSVRAQLDAQDTWTIDFAPSEKISFRRPTRKPLPTLMNFKFFPHSKMFSKTENFLLYNTLYLEIKFTDIPTPKAPHLQHSDHPFYRTPQSISYPFDPG